MAKERGIFERIDKSVIGIDKAVRGFAKPFNSRTQPTGYLHMSRGLLHSKGVREEYAIGPKVDRHIKQAVLQKRIETRNLRYRKRGMPLRGEGISPRTIQIFALPFELARPAEPQLSKQTGICVDI